VINLGGKNKKPAKKQEPEVVQKGKKKNKKGGKKG
jgi:hypothetical protein